MQQLTAVVSFNTEWNPAATYRDEGLRTQPGETINT